VQDIRVKKNSAVAGSNSQAIVLFGATDL